MLVFPTGWAKTIMIKTLYHYTTFISLKEKEISILLNFIQCFFSYYFNYEAQLWWSRKSRSWIQESSISNYTVYVISANSVH